MANTLYVGSDEYTSIQAAIDAAQNGDTIVLKENVTSTGSISIVDKNITVDLGGFTLDAQVYIKNASDVEFKNGSMTYTNTNPSFGSAVITTGIYTDEKGNTFSSGGAAALTLTGVNIRGGEAKDSRDYTHAVYYKSTGGLTITDCTVTGGTVTRTENSTISRTENNTTHGIYASNCDGDIVIKNSTISGGYGNSEGETRINAGHPVGGGDAIYLSGKSNVTIEDSTVSGGSSKWYNANAGINVTNQFSGTLTVVNSTVTGGTAEGKNPSSSTSGIGGVGIYTNMGTSCKEITITDSAISGGDGGMSWNGSGIEYRNANIKLTITGSTVEAGNGENASATGSIGALMIANSTSTQIVLDDVKLNGEGNGNAVIKGGDKGVTFVGPVEVVGGTLENVKVSVDAAGIEGTQAIISGNVGESVEVTVSGNENAVLIEEGGKTYITTETDPANADKSVIYVNPAWADAAENQLVGIGKFFGFNAFNSFVTVLDEITADTTAIEVAGDVTEDIPAEYKEIILAQDLEIKGEGTVTLNNGGYKELVFAGADVKVSGVELVAPKTQVFFGISATADEAAVTTEVEIAADALVSAYVIKIAEGSTVDVLEGGKFFTTGEVMRVEGTLNASGNAGFDAASETLTADDRQTVAHYSWIYGTENLKDNYNTIYSQLRLIGADSKLNLDNARLEVGKTVAGEWLGNPVANGVGWIKLDGAMTLDNGSVLLASGATGKDGYGLTLSKGAGFTVANGSEAQLSAGISNMGTVNVDGGTLTAGTNFAGAGTQAPNYDVANSGDINVTNDGVFAANNVSNMTMVTLSGLAKGAARTIQVSFIPAAGGAGAVINVDVAANATSVIIPANSLADGSYTITYVDGGQAFMLSGPVEAYNGKINVNGGIFTADSVSVGKGTFDIDGASSVNVAALDGVANVKGGTLTDSVIGGVVAVTGDTTLEGSNEFSKIWVSGGTLTVDGDLVTKVPYPAFFVIGNDEKVNATEKGFYNGFIGTEAGEMIVNGSYTAEEGVVGNGGKLTVNGEMTANCLYLRGGETTVAEGGSLTGIVWGGVDAGASLVVDGGTFGTKKADGLGSFSNAGTFTVKGSSTLDIVDFASGTLTVEAGTTLTDSTVAGAGVVQFAANSTTTFEGENKITAALDNSVAGFDFVVNEGASLLITRYTLGYDRNITVKGTIEDATALETLDGVTLSLKADSPSGFSIGGWGTSVLDVDNAYVDLGSSSWKNATGTYTWNFTNSYVKAASFGNNNPAGSDSASWDITFDDSVLSASYIKNSAGVTTSFTNGSVATAGSIRIEGVLDIDETSKVVVTSYQNNKLGSQDEHGDISGTLNIAGELSIKGTGPVELYGAEVNVQNGGTLNLVNDNDTRLDVLVDADSELNIDGNFTAGTITNNGEFAISGESTVDVALIKGNDVTVSGTLKDSNIAFENFDWETGNAMVDGELVVDGGTFQNVQFRADEGEKVTLAGEITAAGATQFKAVNGEIVVNGNFTSDVSEASSIELEGADSTLTIDKDAYLKITGGFYLNGGTSVINGNLTAETDKTDLKREDADVDVAYSTWGSTSYAADVTLNNAYVWNAMISINNADSEIIVDNSRLDGWMSFDITAGTLTAKNGSFVNHQAAEGWTWSTIGADAAIVLTDGSTFDAAKTNLTFEGSITLDATSSFIANTLTGEGTITIDATGFTKGVNKVIDLNGTSSLEGKVTVNGLAEGTVVHYLSDGDVILANADLEKLYFSSEYAEANFGDEVGEGRFFGINAFAEFTDNGTNDKGWSNLLILPEATSEIVLAAGSDVSYGMLRPTQNITVKTEGEGYAVIDRFVNMGSDLTFAEGSKIKVIGNIGLSGANNQGGTVTINGEVYMAIAPSNGNKALYLWGMNDTPGQLVINAGGILKADCANVENHGTITVYGTMELGEQGDAPKLAGVGANNGGWHGHLIVDGKDGEGIVSVAHNQLNFGGGNTSVAWQEPAGDCSVDILNGGKITTAAVSFRNGAKNTLTINKGTLEFTNDPDYAGLTPRYFDNQGVINLTDGTLDMSDRDFNNAGTITVTGESTVKVGKVSGDGWINMDSVTLNDETDIEGGKVRFVNGESTLTGATVNANAFQVGFGGYHAKDERENVADIVVNVTNNSYIHTADVDYNGWVGTGWFESDADKAAAMTDARYTLNIENSVAEFGYFHVSTDGILNVTGNADEKETYTGVSYSYYGGRTMINGVATFDNVDALVLYTNVSCDNGTETPGKLVIQNGANYVSWLDSSSTSDSFKISKTGIVEVDNATLDARHGTLLDTADAKLTIKNNGIFKGYVVTNNGTITVDGAQFNATTVTNAGTFTVTGESTIQIGTYSNGSGKQLRFEDATLVGDSNIGGNAFAFGETSVKGTLTLKQLNVYDSFTIEENAQMTASIVIVDGYLAIAENASLSGVKYLNVDGIADIAGAVNVTNDSRNNFSTLVRDGGTVNLAATGSITGDTYNGKVNEGGTLNINGGSVKFTKYTDGRAGKFQNDGTVNMTAGRLTAAEVINNGELILAESALVTVSDSIINSGTITINVTDTWQGVATVIDGAAGTTDFGTIVVDATDAAAGLTYRIDEATGDLVIYNVETDTVYVDDDWAGTASGTDLGEGKFYGYNAFAEINDAVALAATDSKVGTITVIEGSSSVIRADGSDLDITTGNPDGLVINMGNHGISVNEKGAYTLNGSTEFDHAAAVAGEIWNYGKVLTIGENVTVNADVLFTIMPATTNIDGIVNVNGAYAMSTDSINVGGTLAIKDSLHVADGSEGGSLNIAEGAQFTADNVNIKDDSYNTNIEGSVTVDKFTSLGDVTVDNKGAFTFKEATVGDLNVTTAFEVKEASLTAETMNLYSNLVIDGLQAGEERDVTLSVIPVGETKGFTVKMKVAADATSAVYEGTEIPDGVYDFTVFDDGKGSIGLKGVSVSGGSFSVVDSTVKLGTLNGSADIAGTNSDVTIGTLNGSADITGTAKLNIGSVSGIVALTDAAVSGTVDGKVGVYGTKNTISGESDISTLHVGYVSDNYAVAEDVAVAVTGSLTVGALVVGKYGTLNVGDAEGARTTLKVTGTINWINNSTVKLVNADVESDNALSMTGQVVLDDSSIKVNWEGQMNAGGSDGKVTLKNGSSLEYTSYFYVGGYEENQSAELEITDNSKFIGTTVLTSDTAEITVDASSFSATTLNLKGALDLTNGAEATINDLIITEDGALSIDQGSTISFAALSNAGTITIDAAGATADMIKVLDYTGTADLALEDFGTVSVINGDYTTIERDNDLYIVSGAYSETDVMVNTEWADADAAFGDKVAEGRFFGINAYDSLNDVAADENLTKVTFTGKEEISDLTFAASALKIVFQSAEFKSTEFTGNLTLKGAELSIDADSKINGTITADTGLHVYGGGTIGDVNGKGRFDGEFITAADINGFQSIYTDELTADSITLTDGSDTLNVKENLTVVDAIDFKTGIIDEMVLAENATVTAGVIKTVGAMSVTIDLGGAYDGTAAITVTGNDNGIFGSEDLVLNLDLVNATLGDTNILVSGITEFSGTLVYSNVEYALDETLKFAGKNYTITLDEENKALVLNAVGVSTSVKNDIDGNGYSDIIMLNNAGYSGAWLTQGNGSEVVWADLADKAENVELLGMGKAAGTAALFFHNTQPQNNYVGAWTLEGGKVTGYIDIDTFNDTAEVIGLGDFNGDGTTDVLLRDNTMVGAHITGTGWTEYKGLDDNWEITAVGDFNGDGKDDIVLVDKQNNNSEMWLMRTEPNNEGNLFDWSPLDTLSDNLKIVGAGDVNGDGCDDVLISKAGDSGAWLGAWIIEDGVLTGFQSITDEYSGTIEGVGDFNGDGYDDIQIRVGEDAIGYLVISAEGNAKWQQLGQDGLGKEWTTKFSAIC